MIEVNYSPSERLCQGDVIKNVHYIQKIEELEENLKITIIDFPLVIILTQDCDLERDYKNRYDTENIKNDDKKLISALVAPLYVSEQVIAGTHLEDLKLKMQQIPKGKKGKPSTRLNNLIKNETPRYHYLKFSPESQIADRIIDFKHYFSANVEQLEQLKKDNFICQVRELYREDISQRFANYLSRIGLPPDETSSSQNS